MLSDPFIVERAPLFYRHHDTSWTVSSWTTEHGRVTPVQEEPGSNGP